MSAYAGRSARRGCSAMPSSRSARLREGALTGARGSGIYLGRNPLIPRLARTLPCMHGLYQPVPCTSLYQPVPKTPDASAGPVDASRLPRAVGLERSASSGRPRARASVSWTGLELERACRGQASSSRTRLSGHLRRPRARACRAHGSVCICAGICLAQPVRRPLL